MKNVEALLVNSFTHHGNGGNPAGVVLHAERFNLTNAEKLAVAQAIGYSETAFVAKDDEVDFELSFFTPTEEVDFCGHATLAAFSMMYEAGLLSAGHYMQRTKAGLLAVTIETTGRVVMQLRLPEYRGVLSYEVISELIGLDATLLASTQLPIEIVSTGLADIIVPVPYGYLDTIQVNQRLTADFCHQHNVIGIHAFELPNASSTLTASCRNFAPLVGIAEESATGSASGALACYLTKHGVTPDCHHFTFEQGRAMGCISRISATVESNEHGIVDVQVGGVAQLVASKNIPL
ncbi:MAG: PhzF family phenazine biosynthesis protein [Vibrio sp.]